MVSEVSAVFFGRCFKGFCQAVSEKISDSLSGILTVNRISMNFPLDIHMKNYV